MSVFMNMPASKEKLTKGEELFTYSVTEMVNITIIIKWCLRLKKDLIKHQQESIANDKLEQN